MCVIQVENSAIIFSTMQETGSPGSVDWRGLWTMTTGSHPGTEFVEPYTASIIFFTVNAMAGIVLRALSSAFLPASIRGLVLDFVSTMEACVYFFENNFVYKYYGSVWLAVAIIGQCFVCSRTFGDSSENPTKAFRQLVEREISVPMATIKIVVQSLAGLASYRFAKLIWSLDLISDHHERYYETTCNSDLQVALLFGFGIELFATLSDTWLGMQKVFSNGLLDEFVKYLNGSLMIIVGLTTTGMYFNPAMATGHTLGCEGTAAWEHFLVYWAGPFVGCLVALYINQVLHIDVTAPKNTPDEKTSKKVD